MIQKRINLGTVAWALQKDNIANGLAWPIKKILKERRVTDRKNPEAPIEKLKT
jgi:hypothetical protein